MKTDTEYEVIDIKDLPAPAYQGSQRRGFANFLRQLPEGKAVLRHPREGKTLELTQTQCSATVSSVRQPNQQWHTRLDRTKDGVWVWWEEKT